MHQAPLLLIGCVLFSGCLASAPELSAGTSERVVVLVHGYKGAILETPEHEVAWVTPGAVLSKGEKSLAYSFAGQRAFPRFDSLTATRMFTKITIFPGIAEDDSYLSYARWAQAEFGAAASFAYDWRQDVRTSGKELCAFLETLGPRKKIQLMVHSMGALVSMHCLLNETSAVRASVTDVVFFAPVFDGAPAFLDDLLKGTKTVSNVELLNAEALLTFPSIWQLLPRTNDFAFGADGKPVDVFNAEAFSWGLFADSQVRDSAAYREQLKARMQEHHALWESFQAPASEIHFRSLTVVGRGEKTQSKWQLSASGEWDLEHPTVEDGDGLLPTARAQPWPFLNSKVITVDAEHAAMLRDEGVHAAVRDFLNQP